ncbi:bifunctional UDP-sugar hydrolase/5'-nucleotidase UshA [Zymobacter sp. IVIA_12111.31 C1]|uniref:bifunctional UDP-sugar hydrolase/5'-nucleotidase UshA n=1 Tax=Zymobacter sp. IVIA_12111.31 C1 TaxID=3394854 RepID=UPI0039C289E8
MQLIKKVLVASSFFFLAACSTSTPTDSPSLDTPRHITILHTNDAHGHFWRSDHGEYGLAAQKTIVDAVRREVEAKGGSVLLLSGGDINTGTPASDLQDAEPDFKGMHMMGYDAMAVGNHEFDHVPSVLQKQMGWAGFPILSANIYRKGTNEHAFQPYAIFTRQGVRIAVIGLTTEDTWKQSNPEHMQGLEFRSAQQAVRDEIAELKRHEKPDVIIALSHLGYYPDGAHGTSSPGDVELARALPKGDLSLIVGAHTHTVLCMSAENVLDRHHMPGSPCVPDHQNGTWIVQANEWGKYVGRADFVYRNGQFVLERYQLIPVNLSHDVMDEHGKPVRQPYTSAVAEDSQMLTLLTPFQEHDRERMERHVGTSDRSFGNDRQLARTRQVPLGQLVTAAYLDAVPGDLAFTNVGGLRDVLSETDIRFNNLYRVLPFGNTVVSVTLTGQEMAKYLDALTAIQPGASGYAQTRNLTVVPGKSGLERYRIKGVPLSATRNYVLVTNSFVAHGGDGYPPIDTHPKYVDRHVVDIDAFVRYVERHSPLRVSDYTPR